jgi:hypothetical protein
MTEDRGTWRDRSGDACIPEQTKAIPGYMQGATGAWRVTNCVLGKQDIMCDLIGFIPVAHLAVHAAIRAKVST